MTVETVRLAQREDYQFDITFAAGLPVLRSDEPPPLGQGQGPTPVQMLAGAVGNCLSASLLFAFRKFKQEPGPLGCEVRAEVGRNAEKRLRVLGLDVVLTLGVPAAALEHRDRVLSSFEAYCTVTQSVAPAIPVRLTVVDAEGVVLRSEPPPA